MRKQTLRERIERLKADEPLYDYRESDVYQIIVALEARLKIARAALMGATEAMEQGTLNELVAQALEASSLETAITE